MPYAAPDTLRLCDISRKLSGALLTNPINPNAPFGGKFFETSGVEYDFVREAHEKGSQVLSLVDYGDELVVEVAFSFSNRLGYFILRNS